jgi:glycosyltransferase involved in cell wall biosynthesis
VDVVLGEYGPVCVDYMEACAATGIPLVAHFHGYDAYQRSTLETYRLAYQRVFEVAKVLIVVSRAMGEQLKSLGAPAEKIVWNPCGVDTDFFQGARPGAAAPLLLSVGRFVEKKAPHHVLCAFRDVLVARPDARLLMVGDGVLLDPCRKLAEVLGIHGHVTFAGGRPHSEVASYMRSARAFVQHSVQAADGDSEGTPVSVMEAGAAGLPVIGSRHMGIEDVVVHGETGFLVDEGDTRTMARHMTEMLDNPALAAELGRRGRARVCSEFSMDRSISRLWGALETAIELAGRTRSARSAT